MNLQIPTEPGVIPIGLKFAAFQGLIVAYATHTFSSDPHEYVDFCEPYYPCWTMPLLEMISQAAKLSIDGVTERLSDEVLYALAQQLGKHPDDFIVEMHNFYAHQEAEANGQLSLSDLMADA